MAILLFFAYTANSRCCSSDGNPPRKNSQQFIVVHHLIKAQPTRALKRANCIVRCGVERGNTDCSGSALYCRNQFASNTLPAKRVVDIQPPKPWALAWIRIEGLGAYGTKSGKYAVVSCNEANW